MKLLKTGLKIITKGDGTKLYQPFGVFEKCKIFDLFPITSTWYIINDNYTNPEGDKVPFYSFDPYVDMFAFMDRNETKSLEVLDGATKFQLSLEKKERDRAVVKEEIKILKQY